MFYICTLIQNEHSYLKEWLDYYLNLGVDHIYLFEDGGDSHEEITKNYPQVTLTKLDEDKTKHSTLQENTYNKFLKESMQIGDWCLFIDSDEFLEGITLEEIKSSFKDLQEIPIFWKIYNANNHYDTVDSQLKEFTTLIKNWRVNLVHDSKTLVHKLSENLSFKNGNHHLHLKETDLVKWKAKYYSKFYLKHFYTRSLTDWIKKCKRGFREKHTINDFFKYNPNMR